KYQLNQGMMAETEGFEPSVPDLPVRRFSKPLVSATHPRLRIAAARAGYSGGFQQRQEGALRFRVSPGRNCESARRHVVAGDSAWILYGVLSAAPRVGQAGDQVARMFKKMIGATRIGLMAILAALASTQAVAQMTQIDPDAAIDGDLSQGQ